MALVLLLVNVGSISYNLYKVPFVHGGMGICGIEDPTNDWLISISAVIEAVMLLGQLIPAGYFLLSLCFIAGECCIAVRQVKLSS